MTSFRVQIDGQYGDEDTQIALMDGDVELVMWTSDEWREDPSVVVVIANAIDLGHREGPDAIRERLKRVSTTETSAEQAVMHSLSDAGLCRNYDLIVAQIRVAYDQRNDTAMAKLQEWEAQYLAEKVRRGIR